MPAESRRVPGHCPLRNHPGLSNAGHGSSPRLSHGAWAHMAPEGVPGEGAACLGWEQVLGATLPVAASLPSCRDLFFFFCLRYCVRIWDCSVVELCWQLPVLRGGLRACPVPPRRGLQLGTCCRALRGRCTTSSGCQNSRDLIVLTIRWHRRLRLPAGSPSARAPGGSGSSVPALSPVLGGQPRCRRWGCRRQDGLGSPPGTSCALGRTEGDPGATLPEGAIPPGGREGTVGAVSPCCPRFSPHSHSLSLDGTWWPQGPGWLPEDAAVGHSRGGRPREWAQPSPEVGPCAYGGGHVSCVPKDTWDGSGVTRGATAKDLAELHCLDPGLLHGTKPGRCSRGLFSS